MIEVKKLILLVIIFLVQFSPILLAHSGRTDSSGGHRDNKNVSGLGYYHYHHGQPPHLHTNGICPYDNKSGKHRTNGSGHSSSSYSSSEGNSSFWIWLGIGFAVWIIYNLTKNKHSSNNTEAINSLPELHNSNTNKNIQPLAPTCPRCGSSMVLRHGRYGYFYGCRNYPSCRGTKSFR